jgi:hypothetical protein
MVSLTDYEGTKRAIYQLLEAQQGPAEQPVALARLQPNTSETLSQSEFIEGLRRMVQDRLVATTDNGLFLTLTREGRAEASLRGRE